MHELEPGEGLARVALDAERRGIAIQISPRPEASSLAESAAKLGIEPKQIVKSLVLKRSDDSFIFALVPGGRKIHWGKLRKLLGVNRISLPDADKALEVTHYRRGTITPLGSHTVLPVYIDSSIFAEPQPAPVFLGSGDPGYRVEADAWELVKGLDAVIADISVPE